MRKIYKIAQYINYSIIGNAVTASVRQQFRNISVENSKRSKYYDIQTNGIVLDDCASLNQEFNTEEEALAALASKGFTNDQLKFFEIVVQLRNDDPVTPKSELESIKEIMPEDSPEWAKRFVALLEKQTNAKDSL